MVIVSGGQTGVDRAALDVAIEKGIPYRGWCPRGGWAEDLPQPPGLLARYPNLRETPEVDPLQRTDWNVRDSNALMVLVDRKGSALSKGTEAALDFGARAAKRYVVIDLDAKDSMEKACVWLNKAYAGMALCIAGPRESEAPGIYAKARAYLQELLDY